MSVPEVFFRIKQYFQKKYEQYLLENEFPVPVLLSFRRNLINSEIRPSELYPDTINIFGKEFNYFKEEIDWQKDIFSGECFPVLFSKNINIRDNIKLSAKNVWEINRLEFLPQITLNYRKTGLNLYIDSFINIMSSWIDKNPYLQGINWYSNIEVNIRLINWVLCWEILDVERLIAEREEFKYFVENKWLPSIYQHCQYSFRNPSRFSSANNHLVAEYAGLFAASSLWKFKESEKWLEYSKNGLEKEIQLQHSSGINKEEAAEYIQFISDFFLLSFIVGEKVNRPFSKNYRQQLREIFEYIYNFLDCKGNFPKYGDEDDGRCFNIDTGKESNNFKSLLTSGAIIFKDPKYKSKSAGFDIKNHMLFGDTGKSVYESIPDKTYNESSQFYEKEGHFIFRKKENEKEIYLHFDAAPLGFLSIAAHGHADALSFSLNIDGHSLFVDPGTYTYHTEPEWRRYFIGTLAHNTIRINNKDQAVNAGPTLWLNHYKTKIIDLKSSESTDSVKAAHNGYTKEKVEHVREIIFDKTRNEFHILDTINVKKNKTINIEIPFHFHPGINIKPIEKNSFMIYNDHIRKTEFSIDEKLNPVVLKGQALPQIFGWYSESFLKKEATNAIFCNTRINSSVTFKFVIKIN